MANHLHDDHDDFGGLHRDLLATGAEIGRRRWNGSSVASNEVTLIVP